VPTIAVIDYGIGNLHSASKALERAGARVVITSDPTAIVAADGALLPGVGAMGRCMESLDAYGLRSTVVELAAAHRPFLGICVGMQMLHDGSEEDGGVAGLGLIRGTVRRIVGDVKLPQMQWNVVVAHRQRPSVLLSGLDAPWAYFVHSFAPELHDHVVGVCDYGGLVGAVVERGSVMGTQFHPEKSSADGIAILANFVQSAAVHACSSSTMASS
jgi:imidazole glycerol-phosphate synthase subunit HisH